MNDSEKIVREFALKRIADVFNVSVEAFSGEAVFGEQLTATRRPGLFKRNEYDSIYDDILDVCYRAKYKEISSGNLVIRSVDDYCDHMIQCYKKNSKDVIATLNIPRPVLD